MEIANARRQVEEVTALQLGIFNHAIRITTPALLQRLERCTACSVGDQHALLLPVKKCLALDVHCNKLDIELDGLVLQIELPLDYPSNSICRVGSTYEGEACDVGARVSTFLQSFTGCECLETIFEWLSDHRGTCLLSKDSVDEDGREGMATCFVLRFNHLLQGPEHKKEKSMVDAARKSKLQGGILWGTPGIVVVVPPSTEEDARDYSSDCRDIGKRADGVETMFLPKIGLEEAGLGGLAQQKRGGKIKDMDTATLRTACGGDESLLKQVLDVR